MTTESPPDQFQQADIVPIRILIAVQKNSEDLDKLTESIKTLNELLASHIRANLDTMREIREYIGNQLNYRMVRADMDEQRLRLEIDQKNLELQFMEKRVSALIEENIEADQVRLEYEKAKLEIGGLRKTLEIVQTTREDTSQKIKRAGPAAEKPKRLADRVKETIVLTAASVITASVLGGTLAFIYWLLRQWILGANVAP